MRGELHKTETILLEKKKNVSPAKLKAFNQPFRCGKKNVRGRGNNPRKRNDEKLVKPRLHISKALVADILPAI